MANRTKAMIQRDYNKKKQELDKLANELKAYDDKECTVCHCDMFQAHPVAGGEIMISPDPQHPDLGMGLFIRKVEKKKLIRFLEFHCQQK